MNVKIDRASALVGLLFVGIMLASFSSCKRDQKTFAEPEGGGLKTVDKPVVEITNLETEIFNREILSNGKLTALHKAEMRFQVSETIQRIFVKNGDRVKSGQVLAILDNFSLKNSLNRSKTAFEKAKVDLQDVLIGQGYPTGDWSKIPPEALKMARIKSGYENALYDLESAEHLFQNTCMKAPFSGVVCNLKAKENNIPGGDPICTLVDNSCFDAEFSVLESELSRLKTGQLVELIPFANKTAGQIGVVTEINPLVDENGLVTVKARVTNKKEELYEGMNVRVLIKQAVPNCLVVPKSAVVLRLGKEVLFTYEDGRAKWHYVKTTDENSTGYLVTGDIQAGVKVIVSGNLNLGHNAQVLLK